MEAAHAPQARLPAPLTLLAPGCRERVERRVAGQAENVVAAHASQQIQNFRRAVVTVAPHENIDMRPVPAEAMDDVLQHTRDLLSRRPLAGADERRDRLARARLEDVDRLEAMTARVRIEQRQLLLA